MRYKLAPKEGARITVRATVKQFGGKLLRIPEQDIEKWEDTLLLVNVIDIETKELLTDHTWMGMGRGFRRLELNPGDVIQLEARVEKYKKKDGDIDYHLKSPTKIKYLASKRSSLLQPQR